MIRFVSCIFLFVFINTLSLYAQLDDETVFLTWQRDPQTTMTIQWISSISDTASSVFYKKKNANEVSKEQNGQIRPFPHSPEYLIHRVELVNLSPNTLYAFTISKEGREYCFITAPSDLKEDILFVVGGDMYHDTQEKVAKTSKVAAHKNPLFALVGGDIAYAVRSSRSENNPRWIEWVKLWHKEMVSQDGRLIPVIAALGNHDIIGQFGQTPLQAAVYSTLFPLPGDQGYATLDFGCYLSIIILDSGHAHSIEGEQTQWLSKTLEQRKNQLHRFALYHVPAYPSIRDFNNVYSATIRTSWVPLFEKWRLHAAFEHHDHAYKRTHPLLKNAIHPQGIIYFGDGAWGVDNPRKQKKSCFYIAKFASIRYILAVTLSQNKETFRCFSEDDTLIDEYQQVFDKEHL